MQQPGDPAGLMFDKLWIIYEHSVCCLKVFASYTGMYSIVHAKMLLYLTAIN